jgi:hypothetical protein
VPPLTGASAAHAENAPLKKCRQRGQAKTGVHGEFLCYLLFGHHRARVLTKEVRICAKHLHKKHLYPVRFLGAGIYMPFS